MSKENLCLIFSRMGFIIEELFEYRRNGLPIQFHYNGRENIGLIARETQLIK